MPKVDKDSPLYPSPYGKAQALAIQALSTGTANEQQQKDALSYIINTLCGTYDQPFRPTADGARETDFACGKMWVGQQIVKLTKVKVANLK